MDTVNQLKCQDCSHGKSMFCIHCNVKFTTLPYSNYFSKGTIVITDNTDNTL